MAEVPSILTAIAAFGIAVAGCGHPDGSPIANAAGHDEPARPPGDASVTGAPLSDVAARPLGLAEADAFRWRKRPGQPSFRLARKAESRGDWAMVVSECQHALAADPLHLEAAWLLAVGHAKLGHASEILAPLQVAASGDFGKWAQPSLELPALQTFVTSPLGQAWRRRVEADRVSFTSSLAHAVIAIAGGDVLAYDSESHRWSRLTRTYGAVVATMPSGDRRSLVYVSRTGPKSGSKLSLGTIDLTTGVTTRGPEVGATSLVVAWAQTGFVVAIGSSTQWRQLDGTALQATAITSRPPGPWLEVSTKTARLHRLPVADITADWDDHSLAGAIRIGRSNRVVTVPSPGLIDGNTIVWSPDRVHLAFVAQLDEHCTPGKSGVAAAAFLVDAATGVASELERAQGGLAVEWLADRRLAIAGDHGVSIVELDGSRTQLAGTTGLGAPRKRPRCTPVADEIIEPTADEPD